MSDRYVGAAIDHGTTNSSIAIMEQSEPRVIQNKTIDHNGVMPSAVYMDRRGKILVGAPAYSAMMINDASEGNGHTGYKPNIGQDDRYAFPAAGKVMKAQELGATVIGALIQAYRNDQQRDLKAAVITVPAKFEQNASDGTREAAKMAGLAYFPLFPEPCAAALAYGFEAESDRGTWMIFDLGGGTLDVSLVVVRNRKPVVPENGFEGDNILGGQRFARDILDWVLGELGGIPGKKVGKYLLKRLVEDEARFAPIRGRLLLAVEQAKIELSSMQETWIRIEGPLCKDDNGREVLVEVPFTRDQYQRMIAHYAERAVEICQRLLRKNRMTPRDIERLILVGGPTKTPYIRKVLSERLNIQIDAKIDPMTAVVRGAAIHANTLEIPDEIRKTFAVPDTAPQGVKITIEAERSSNIPRNSIVGKVQGLPSGMQGLSVSIRREDGLWDSGRLPIGEDGVFFADLMLVDKGKPFLSRFTTTAFDSQGRPIAEVAEPEIWFPYPRAGGVPLPNSLGVALSDNSTQVLVAEATKLPAKGSGEFATAKKLERGNREDSLRFPVIESITNLFGTANKRADCCVQVGSLVIRGNDERITRDLPQGTKVEFTIAVSEERLIIAKAFIPLIDEEFEAEFKRENFGITAEKVEARLNVEKDRLKKTGDIHQSSPIAQVQEMLDRMNRVDQMAMIEKELDRFKKGESTSGMAAWKHTLELAGSVDMIEELQAAPRISQQLSRMRASAKSEDEKVIRNLEQDLDAALSTGNPQAVAEVEKNVNQLDLKMRKAPFFVLLAHVAALNGMRVNQEQGQAFKDADTLLGRLIEKGGADNLTQHDLDEIKRADERLQLLYSDIDERTKKFIDGLPGGEESLSHLRRS